MSAAWPIIPAGGMRRVVQLALVSLLYAAPSAAQFIQGEVVSANDMRRLPGMRVVLYDDADEVAGDTRSDSADAAYFFDLKHPGQYQLAVFDRLGNAYTTPQFTVGAGVTVERQLMLPPLPAMYDGVPVAKTHLTLTIDSRQHSPRFPGSELSAGRPGQVRVAYIVNPGGDVEPGSVHIISATNAAFADAVTAVQSHMHYLPPADGTVPIRAIDQETYTFNISGNPTQIPCVSVCITALGVGRVRR